MSVTAIRAPGSGRGTDIGFERRHVPGPGEARRIAANIAKPPESWMPEEVRPQYEDAVTKPLDGSAVKTKSPSRSWG